MGVRAHGTVQPDLRGETKPRSTQPGSRGCGHLARRRASSAFLPKEAILMRFSLGKGKRKKTKRPFLQLCACNSRVFSLITFNV